MQPTSPLTYEAAMTRLDILAQKMESGDIPIDTLASTLKEAQELIAFCRDKLTRADAEVTKLLNPQSGSTSK